MVKVALTGGIATGKSYALARFREMGLPTIDADEVVHGLLRSGSPALPPIRARFGAAVMAAGGDVDRRALGAVVFKNAEARRALEAILHPLAYRAIEEWFEIRGQEPGRWLGIADIPLLYETGREGAFDAVVVTACAPDLQLRRIMERDGLSEAEARQRLDAQWPIEEKARRADWVIRTDGSPAATNQQVADVAAAMRARWA